MGLLTFVHDPCYYVDSERVRHQENATYYEGFGWLTYYGDICTIRVNDRQWFVFRAYAAPVLVAVVEEIKNPFSSGAYKSPG